MSALGVISAFGPLAALLLAGGCGEAQAQEHCKTGVEKDPAEVINAFERAYNARDFEGLRAVVTADASIRRTDGSVLTGSGLIADYRNELFKMIPDIRIEAIGRRQDGQRVIQTERATAAQIPGPDIYTVMYEVRGGCIVRMVTPAEQGA